MEATVMSMGKSVVAGALGYAKSAIAEEVALQLGVHRDQAFITDELEMMQGFLMVAHDERDTNQVVKIWMKQVRDMAYDVEDCLQDFAVRLENQSWWRIFRTLQNRRRVAKEMKELRAKVEDVSQRNMRYCLINVSGSKPGTVVGQSTMANTTMFGIDEARRASKQDKSKVDILELINKKDNDGLRVISVWGTSADLGQTSIIRAAYDNPDVKSIFPCRAWVRMAQPFNPKDFIQSLVEQFHQGPGVDIMLNFEKTGEELTKEFKEYVNAKRYLIVLNELSSIEDWDRVKKCLPDNTKGSRILVSTTQGEVAKLCAGQESIVSELKQLPELRQLSTDQNIYAFHEKVTTDGVDLMTQASSSSGSADNSTMPASTEIREDTSEGSSEKNSVKKSLTRVRTMAEALEESRLVGREKEKSDIITLVSNQDVQHFPVISVWGMGGLGKTTLAKDIYQRQELNDRFEKRAFVTIMHPVIVGKNGSFEKLLRDLVTQLTEDTEKKTVDGLSGSTKKSIEKMQPADLNKELARLLKTKRCLIILDDISSTAEWDMIKPCFPESGNTSRIIVTTREEKIAKHCSARPENIYMLQPLDYNGGLELFMKKVFKKTVNLHQQYPDLVEQAELILRICDGLPLAISTIGGYLSNQPINVIEWRNLIENISAELEMNPELETIRTVLITSYDGLPYHLKSCFLYLSIFHKDCMVSRRRLVRRWTAEGYSTEVRGKSMVEIADSYFIDLISRSMILPSQQSTSSRKGKSCQLHDLIREIGISKSMEENLVFWLEEGCSSNRQGKVRHLAINSNWEGDKSEFESMVDLSRVRSITVFGKWRPFFISANMRLLRVLDLEDTYGMLDHHLEHIGKLLHLRYLSLRGCQDIDHLPDSLGNLRQLETLDVTGTSIARMPCTITKLKKLQHILAGRLKYICDSAYFYEGMQEPLPKLLRNKLCTLAFYSVGFCVACCSPQQLKTVLEQDGDVNRRDVCTVCCCGILPFVVTRQSPCGVVMPRGFHKLKALHTLGVVDVSGTKSALRDIKRLTQLRKLGVIGINKRKSEEFLSALAGLRYLESLLVRSEGKSGLFGCLDGISLSCKNLQSLKLYGNLVKLPEGIEGLNNLVKLKLLGSRISDPKAAIQVLGDLPNLAILCLWDESFDGEDVRFCFPPSAFSSLVVLEICLLKFEAVVFEEGATPKLELLKYFGFPSKTNIGLFSGLPSLTSLREFLLDNDDYEEDFVEDLRDQLSKNKNGAVLRRY